MPSHPVGCVQQLLSVHRCLVQRVEGASRWFHAGPRLLPRAVLPTRALLVSQRCRPTLPEWQESALWCPPPARVPGFADTAYGPAPPCPATPPHAPGRTVPPLCATDPSSPPYRSLSLCRTVHEPGPALPGAGVSSLGGRIRET